MKRRSEDGVDLELEHLDLDALRIGVLEANVHSITDVIGIVKDLVEVVNEAVIITGGITRWGLAPCGELLVDLIEEWTLRGCDLIESGGDVARVSVVLVIEFATENELRVWVEGDVVVGGVAKVEELVAQGSGGWSVGSAVVIGIGWS
jgi:hypothetical protein